MKHKIIIPAILIVLAIASSATILIADGYFEKNKVENKVLAVEQPIVKPVVLAVDTTQVKKPVIKKATPIKKKAPVKKKTTKKPVVKKKSVNLAPPVFTPQTAPYSAKNKYN